MAGYSNTPLVKKLGIKEGSKLYFKNQPDHYLKLLQPLPDNLTITKKLVNELDFIHFFVRKKFELEKGLTHQITRIKQNGMIWVSWPKKSSGLQSDISEDTIREVALPMGLVDIKVCAVDETWSALKLVIRKKNRQ